MSDDAPDGPARARGQRAGSGSVSVELNTDDLACRTEYPADVPPRNSPSTMLPWNPPSAFSLTGDQQQQQRYGYSDASGSQMQNNHQQQQSPTANQQQQMSPQQQQQQLAPGAIPPPPTNQSAYPPMTLAATLHFLQSEHRRYARDRNEWEIERAEMRARIALLEGEKRGNEAALKSLGRRCKMLEMALRGERCVSLVLAASSCPRACSRHSGRPRL